MEVVMITGGGSDMGRTKRIKNFYLPWLSGEKGNAKKLAWESTYNQLVRFQALVDNVNLNEKSILDVGCGLGDLYDYLERQGIDVHYTGVDILDVMIENAQKKHPGADFIKTDIFKSSDVFDGRKFDVVYASGTFNLKLGNNEKFIEDIARVFSTLSREVFAFNLLHERSSDPIDTYYYTHPEKVLPVLKKYSSDVKVIDDYLENDFTVICKSSS